MDDELDFSELDAALAEDVPDDSTVIDESALSVALSDKPQPREDLNFWNQIGRAGKRGVLNAVAADRAYQSLIGNGEINSVIDEFYLRKDTDAEQKMINKDPDAPWFSFDNLVKGGAGAHQAVTGLLQGDVGAANEINSAALTVGKALKNTAEGAVISTVETAPYTGSIMAEGAKTGLTTGLLTGAAGFVTGVAAGQLTPGSLVDDLLAGATTAAKTGIEGFSLGSTIGSFHQGYVLMSGDAYADMVQRGLDPEKAKFMAHAIGITSAALEVLQLKGLGAVGKRALSKELRTTEGRAALRSAILDLFKEGEGKGLAGEVLKQITEEELQELTTITGTVLEAALEGDITKAPNVEEIITDLVSTGWQAVGPSALMVGAAHGGGKLTGMALKGSSMGLLAIIDKVKRKETVYSVTEASMGAALGSKAVAETIRTGRYRDAGMAVLEGLLVGKKVEQTSYDDRGEKIQEGKSLLKEGVLADPTTDVNMVMDTDTVTLRAQVERVDITEGPMDVEGGVIASSDGEVVIDPNAANKDEASGETKISKTRLENPAYVKDAAELQERGGVKKLREEGFDGVVILPESETDNPLVVVFNPDNIQQTEDPTTAKVEDTRTRTRLNQISKEVEELQKTTSTYEKLFTEREKAGKSTKAVVNQLETIYQSIDELNTEADLLTSGELKVGQNRTELTTYAVNQARLKQVQARVKEFEKGVKAGANYTELEIKNVQNAVASVIRTSGMSPVNKSKFLASLKNIRTSKDLQKQLPVIKNRMAQLLEKELKSEQRKRLGRLLKRTQLTKSGKHPKGKYTAAIQKALDYYRTFAYDRDTSNRMVGEIQKRMQEEGFAGLSPEDAMVLSIANDMARLKTMSSKELNRVNNDLERLIEEGKHKALEKYEARQKQKRAREALAKTHLIDARPSKSRKAEESAVRKVQKKFAGFKSSVLPWDYLMYMVAAYSENTDTFVEEMSVSEAVRDEMIILRKSSNRFLKSLKTAFPEKKNLRRWYNEYMREASTGIKEYGTFTDRFGKPVMLEGTKAEIMDIRMKMLDPSLRETLAGGIAERADGSKYVFGNGFTFKGEAIDGVTTEALIEEALSDDDNRIIELLLQEYRESYKENNAFHEERSGAPMPYNDFYSPKSTAAPMKIAKDQVGFGHVVAQLTNIPGSTIARVDTKNRIEFKNPFDTLQDHWVDWANYRAWASTIDKVQDVFNNPDVRDHIKTIHGRGAMRTIDQHIKYFINQRSLMYKEHVGLWRKMRMDFPGVVLGANLSQIPKQMTAIVGFLEYVNPIEMAQGQAAFLSNPAKAIKILQSSPVFMERYSDGVNVDMMRANKHERFAAFGSHSDLQEALFAPVKYGDMISVVAGGYSVYLKEFKKTGSHEKAIRKFEEAIDSTQQSSNVNRLNAIQQDPNVFNQLMFVMFQSQPWQAVAKEVNAVDRIVYGPKTAKNIAANLKTIFIFHSLMPAFFSYVSHLGATDEDAIDDYIRAAILGPLSQINVASQLLEAGWSWGRYALTGKESKLFEFESTPTEFVEDIKKVTRNLSHMNSETKAKTIWDTAKTMSSLYGTFAPRVAGGGLPWPKLVSGAETAVNYISGKSSPKETVDYQLSNTAESVDVFKRLSTATYTEAQLLFALAGWGKPAVASVGKKDDNDSSPVSESGERKKPKVKTIKIDW